MRKLLYLTACVFTVIILQSTLHAQEQEEPPAAPPSLAEEAERLKTLKKAEFEKLKSIVSGNSTYGDKLSALKKIAALDIPEAIELFASLYDNPTGETDKEKSDERVLLVGLLGQMGSPAASSTILKAAQDPGKKGKLRLAAAAALPRVMEKQALPYLKKLTEDKVEDVKNRAWLELLKMRDMKAMRYVFKMLDGEKKLNALEMIKEAHFTEAVEDVAKLAKETDFTKGPTEKILKLKALETALDLGHIESVEIAIELIGTITKEQAEVLQVCHPKTMLHYYCAERFDSGGKKWQEWWDSKGKDIPLFSRYADSTTLTGITEAVAKYIKESKFEPGLDYSVVYLWETHLTKDFSTIDDSIRVYRKTEIHLLKLKRKSWRVRLNWTNNRKAFVSVGSNLRSNDYYFELYQSNSKWKVNKIDGKPVKAP